MTHLNMQQKNTALSITCFLQTIKKKGSLVSFASPTMHAGKNTNIQMYIFLFQVPSILLKIRQVRRTCVYKFWSGLKIELEI